MPSSFSEDPFIYLNNLQFYAKNVYKFMQIQLNTCKFMLIHVVSKTWKFLTFFIAMQITVGKNKVY